MGRDATLLLQLQHLPLSAKILLTKQRIREWYNYFCGDVCVSFSGGKDSTVLAHLVHLEYPDVPLVFSNTGLEYPEIQAFARKMGAEFIRPKMQFSEVISKYGYPIISKEVAEAIHYARRIVPLKNFEGGVQRTGRERNCAEKERERERERVSNRKNRMAAGESHKHASGVEKPSDGRLADASRQRAGSNSTGRDRMEDSATGNRIGGYSRRELLRIKRARRELLGKY